jgi:hypothetical protein
MNLLIIEVLPTLAAPIRAILKVRVGEADIGCHFLVAAVLFVKW